MNIPLKIYEINARVWIKKFSKGQSGFAITDVPGSYWDYLKGLGFNAVWLMGIWKTNPDTIEKYCFTEPLKNNYSKALKNWKKEDIVGSPYSIDVYEISSIFGSEKHICALREILNSKGMKLFLDFVPNHFNAESRYVYEMPEMFLQADKEIYDADIYTFYKPDKYADKHFAHGRDPFFPAWQDTIQVNFYNPAARKSLTDILKRAAELCDGVRCDMAMLPLNNVFSNTWSGVINKMNIRRLPTEFWKEAISDVRKEHPEFMFIAEAYWDLEWDLQQLGFDYTYDKKLLDHLRDENITGIKLHLSAEKEYRDKSLRFIENHDEERALKEFGKNRSLAAAAVISSIPGGKLYHDGQFEGARIKLPVQLGRAPEETLVECVKDYYGRILEITKTDIFNKGEWQIKNPIQAWANNFSFRNFLAWEWQYKDEKRLVVINYADTTSQCRIIIEPGDYGENILFKDILNVAEYLRSAEEVCTTGLYIELKNFQTHIFSY
jgi:glycosidase